MTTTIYPNSKIYKIREILNAVFDGADLTGVNSYDPGEILNSIFDESALALKIKLDGGTPTVDAITVAEGTVPDTPDSGYAVIWFDTSDKHLKTVDDTGAVVDLTTGLATDFVQTDSPGTPDAGSVRLYFDTDGVLHAIDSSGDDILYQNFPVESGSAGSVGVVEGVTTPTIHAEIFAKTFDKNVLLREGDDLTFTTTTAKNLGSSDIETTDVLLARVNLKSVTTSIRIAKAALAAKFYNATVLSAVGVYYGFLTYYSGWNGSDNLISPVNETSGTSEADYSVFNLTALGTYTAEQVLALASLGVTVTTADSWEDIASATGYSADIWDILIPSHVSSMEPTIVSSLVNRGGNLAYLPDVEYGSDSNMTYTKEDESIYVENSIAGLLKGVFLRYELSPNTTYTISRDFEVLVGADADLGRIIVWDEEDGSRANQILNLPYSSTSGQFTTPDNGIAQIEFLATDNTSELGKVKFYNIQLNEGSTANTYSAPLDSPFTVGSRSVNQLRNGNGEEGSSTLSEWTVNQTSATFEWNASNSAFELTRNTDNVTAKSKSIYLHDNTLTLFFNGKSDVAVLGRMSVNTYKDGVASDTLGDYSNFTRASAGSYYYDSTTSYVEKSIVISGVDYFTITFFAYNADGTTSFKELMIIKGEYTLAQLQDLGYVSYEPVTLLSCPNNAETSTVGDRIYGEDGKIWLEHNVQTVDGFKYGDPEIDATDLVTNNEGDFPVDVVDITAFQAGYSMQFSATTSITVSVTSNVLSWSQGASASRSLMIADNLTVGNKYTLKGLNITGLTGDGYRLGDELGFASGNQYQSFLATGLYDITFIALGTELHFKTYTSGNTCELTQTTGFTLVEHNIQENLAPTLEDITEFCNGSLGQPATYGQNHIVSDEMILTKFTVYTGLNGIVKDVVTLKESVAYKTDLNPRYFLEHVSTAGLAGSSSTVVEFSDITGFPDYIEGAQDLTPSDFAGKYDTNVDSVDVFPNAIVINTDVTGTGALDVSCKLFIGAVEPKVTYVGA